MFIGAYVYYKNNKDCPIDITIGIIEEVNPKGMVYVYWFDGCGYWMNPIGLVLV